MAETVAGASSGDIRNTGPREECRRRATGRRRHRCLRWTVSSFEFARLHMRKLGREPNLTSMKTALPAKRTCHATSRFVVGCFDGMRRCVTRRQCAYVPTTGKSLNASSTLPRGTEGPPSCPAASAGNQKLPTSTQAAARALTTPGPTELNQPLSERIQSTGPQFPRPANGRAELVSTAPSAHVRPTTTTRLIVTQDVTAAPAPPVLHNYVPVLASAREGSFVQPT